MANVEQFVKQDVAKAAVGESSGPIGWTEASVSVALRLVAPTRYCTLTDELALMAAAMSPWVMMSDAPVETLFVWPLMVTPTVPALPLPMPAVHAAATSAPEVAETVRAEVDAWTMHDVPRSAPEMTPNSLLAAMRSISLPRRPRSCVGISWKRVMLVMWRGMVTPGVALALGLRAR